jgi:hypothetical protein
VLSGSALKSGFRRFFKEQRAKFKDGIAFGDG